MKNFSTAFFCAILLASFTSHGANSYSIFIDKEGYKLQMAMEFHQDLSIVEQGLKNSTVLSRLSPNVKSVQNTSTGDSTYDSLMVVKSMGMKSELLSQCKESRSSNEWTRHCDLQTDKKDGGEYMNRKYDHVVCTSESPLKTICKFDIQGQAKDLKILGIRLLSAERFSVKAKYQALGNFFKLFYFIQNDSLSTKQALELFENSSVKKDMDFFADEADRILKDQSTYNHDFVFEEEI